MHSHEGTNKLILWTQLTQFWRESLYFTLHYITRIKKSIVLFVLLRGRGIKSGFPASSRFLCVMTSQSWHRRKTLFHVTSLLGDLVITYRTNLAWIVPRAFRTVYDQCPVHIRIFTMFTGIFRVKDGGRFRAITFCFLTVVFSVVVVLLGVFSFSAIRRSYLLVLSIYIAPILGSIFSILEAFFLSNPLGPFCSWSRPYWTLTPQVHLERYSAHEAW